MYEHNLIHNPEITEVEDWQIISISRLDPSECLRWGEGDGAIVLEWFDRGELQAQDPGAEQETQLRGRRRMWEWLRGICGVGGPELQLAGAR